jgi:molybdopterin biosynthesis enzyme
LPINRLKASAPPRGQKDHRSPMASPLIRLDDALRPALARLEPVTPRDMPLAEAVGGWLAAPLIAPQAVPAEAIALRAGLAVEALALIGASPHAPVMLTAAPPCVGLGETLPAGTDAIIDPASLSAEAGFWEATDSPAPGQHVRRTGHDLARGARIAAEGARVTPALALVAARAGFTTLPVRRAGVSISGPHCPEAEWLAGELATLGARLTAPQEADLQVTLSSAATPMLALNPGETGGLSLAQGRPLVAAPARFDGLVGVWCALVLPLMAALHGLAIAQTPARLSRKIASQVGLSELALFALAGDSAEPLAVGEVTLAALARADAFAILPPESEGAGAGAMLPVTRLTAPFTSGDPTR